MTVSPMPAAARRLAGTARTRSYGVDAAFMLLEEAAEKVWRIPACLPALRSI
jgi:hypothetical protein